MLDIKWLGENSDSLKDRFGARFDGGALNRVRDLNDQRKKLQLEFDTLRAEQNRKSGEIAARKKSGQDASDILKAMPDMSARVKDIGAQQSEAEEELKRFALTLPNLPHESVPPGTGADDNKLVRQWGEPASFAFKPQEHWAIGENLGLLDFDRAAKISGARFAILKGPLAKLERALITFMLDVHTRENGYEEILPPFLVNAETMTGTGQLPKFEADAFKTTTGLYLIPTAEVPVTNLFRGEILDEKLLPKKYCAYTPCFRSEAGSYGKDMKGLIRQHQFNKVELVQITRPEESGAALEQLTGNAEKILQKLNLPYRVMLLCTGDMGFSSTMTYDIEVWLPGQNAFREISSCSNCGDFQARRMNTRFRRASAKAPEYVHTLNGSGLAVGRTLIAILENYQREDGTVEIPEVLRIYMGGMEVIQRPSL